MIALKALQGQVTALTDDLRGQVHRDSELESSLTKEHGQATDAKRTAATFETWLEDILDQAAVAWVLGCVFVRFCEDNGLVEPLWIGGPEPAAPVERAVQNRQQHLIENPLHNDRHWLREAFGYLGTLKATGKIFDEHNPVWRFPVSGEAAEKLSDFFRRGPGLVSLRRDDLDTRFLGDLYQDLSTHAKKTYALLQTPEFVEEFILDRTFEPAVKEFGLSETSVIDPTCGSGHFLLGAFGRLVARWKKREPATDIRVLVERALGQVTGVDINPFAVAIARFRLLIAAMKECGLTSLERTPAWTVRVATGDSLLHWGRTSRHQGDLMAVLEGRNAFAYATEDADMLGEYLQEGQYSAVVGNPPYITVSDKARNQAYREIYPAVCHRQYALTVPFVKRFFDLARRGDLHGDSAGYVGQITGNSFMKREFGRKLIEGYLAFDVELRELIDLSGAYVPGHGTPTVILIGRASSCKRSASVRAVLGIQGEPMQPADPATGAVWSAIVRQIDLPGSESKWISVVEISRDRLSRFPWSLAGGGASSLMNLMEGSSRNRLGQVVQLTGFMAVTRADDAYLVDRSLGRRLGIDTTIVPFVSGNSIRDHTSATAELAIFPYSVDGRLAMVGGRGEKILWPNRAFLRTRLALSGTQEERGLTWFEYSDFHPARWSRQKKIAFAVVATHNHFVLDRGGRLFNRHSPVVQLPDEAQDVHYLDLLSLLNSSIVCFWLKQVSQNKGNGGVGGGIGDEAWEPRYEFTGTKLRDLPLYVFSLGSRVA